MVWGGAGWLQARLAHCLSSPLVRRWFRAEWMYSALELPWFARNEFTDYLRHLRLHHITALTRAEWGSFRRWVSAHPTPTHPTPPQPSPAQPSPAQPTLAHPTQL